MHGEQAGPLPLYQQIRNILLEKIARGELKVGDRLPSERQISSEHNLSRMTVRQALAELSREGWIQTSAGKGRYVAPRKLEQQWRRLTGFTEDMRRRGMAPSSQIMQFGILPAPTELAQHLQIPTGVPIIRLERLRLADGLPLALETAHLAHDLCPGLLQYDFSRQSLYDVLQSECHLVLAMADQVLEVGLADERQLALFGLVAPAPVLCMQRTTYLDNGRAIEFVQSVYRGDWYRIHTVLQCCDQGSQEITVLQPHD